MSVLVFGDIDAEGEARALAGKNLEVGMSRSAAKTKPAPIVNPTAIVSVAHWPTERSAISIAGASNDQNDAADMTPAAKPKLKSKRKSIHYFTFIVESLI